MKKTIEIPEGYEARIEGNKVILEPKESEDEKMIRIIEDAICTNEAQQLVKTKYGLELTNLADWLEKQGNKEYALKSSKDVDVHKFVQYIERQAKAYELNLPNRSYDIYGFAKDILSWLEKQGEQDTDISSFPKEQQVFMQKYVSLDKITLIKLLAERDANNAEIIESSEKQSEQRPVDKIEPKFKVGDWVVYKEKDVDKIVKFDNEKARFESDDWLYIDELNKDCKLWTIQDAKDGDVLTTDIWTFIFKKYQDKSVCYHCATSAFKDFSISDTGEFDSNYVHPATKEQRDLLFQKMKEAGYEWDAEKKELKKIEQPKLTKFEDAIKDMMDVYRDAIDDNDATVEEVKEHAAYLLSLIPQNPAWSEEDEISIDEIIETLNIVQANRLRTQRTHYSRATIDKDITFLKALKERYTWKPSDEQMSQLECVAKQNKDNILGKELMTLFNDLNKLKG